MATTKKKASAEKITLVPLSDLHERLDNPIKMRDDDTMQETIESVKRSGVLTPGIARPRAEGGYELIAGRRRKLACEAAGLETMPVIIRDLDEEQAIIEMVDSGIQREKVRSSEKAADIAGKAVGESGRQVQRYIRLTELSPELQQMVDTGWHYKHECLSA